MAVNYFHFAWPFNLFDSNHEILIFALFLFYEQTSAVEISQIVYENISGTSKSPNAIKFACSDTVPCTNIALNNIKLKRTDGKSAQTFCNSVMGFAIGHIEPPADCLMPVNNSFCDTETKLNREYLIHSEL
ncbi:putative endo-polygalacturonase [Helianthus annuus]|nr:putative endo-polygalacturonase [Helianthus annuus]